jgi:predicted negative regulator of RcsB-dependent stress response
MDKEQRAFQMKLEEQAQMATPGVLDQLNLPPGFILFLQKNQRKIWTLVAAVATVVIVSVLYTSYQDYRLNRAVKAYDQALMLEAEDEKRAALEQVIQRYGSTPSGLWSRVALAHLDQAEGKNQEALTRLTALEKELGDKNLLKPLVFINMAVLYEREKNVEQAASTYQRLKAFKGFEALALNHLGQLHEANEQPEQAVTAYQQYMGLAELAAEGNEPGQPSQNFSARDMVQASLNRLIQ